MKPMSEMNYEKAWKVLKSQIGILAGLSLHFVESEDKGDDERLKAKGGKFVASQILKQMDRLENAMTTAGEDDGQSAQD